MIRTTLLVAWALFSSALAQQTATIVLQSGSGENASNTTVSIDINDTYDNANSLAGVSALYLTGASGVSVNSITCTPFSNPDGTARIAPTFDSSNPSRLSANDVIGSIVCITTSIPKAPMVPPMPGSSTTLATTGRASTASTLQGATATPQGTSTSPSSSQSTDNAASSLFLSGQLFGGLAIAGFGAAFAL